MQNLYHKLLNQNLPAESFARQALSLLESQLREISLLALHDWSQLKISLPNFFQAIVALSRPAWGAWNGLLHALRKQRRNSLRDADETTREKIQQAKLLKSLLSQLDQKRGN